MMVGEEGEGTSGMEAGAVERAAMLLVDNRLARHRLRSLPVSCRPRNEDEAYAIQDVMNIRLEKAGFGSVVGYKVGCTTPVMQRYMGIDHPGAGAVLAPTVYSERVTLAYRDFVEVGVETEIAARLGRDLPAEDAPFNLDSVMAAVDACMPAIELVDARYENYRTLDVWTMVADNFFNAGCILGTATTEWRCLDLTRVIGRTTVNEVEVGSGAGANVLGHPFEAIVWLANTLARRGRGLRAGDFVLTGSIVETQWVHAGDSVVARIDGLGEVAVVFA